MSQSQLNQAEKQELLALARQSIELTVAQKPFPAISREQLTPALSALGAAFVTLTINGELRGCIGSLQAYRPLIEDVREHAVDAAFNDYRFMPVTAAEVPLLEIEISHLSAPQPLEYTVPEDLPRLLHPNIDGVVLRDGPRSATFLPQVWEELPIPQEFLNHLCLKMGASANLWRRKKLQVSIYYVDEFHE